MSEKKIFLHERSWCESINIGKGTRIWGNVHIMKDARIGKNVNVGENCFIENDVVIGDEVVIKNGISIWDGISIEDRVFLGPHMVFTNDMFPRAKVHHENVIKTFVKYGATIGANATVICGNTIGKFSMIGAGSVVTKDVPDYGLVFGNPAKLHGYICKCTNKIIYKNNYAKCKCGREYKFNNNLSINISK